MSPPGCTPSSPSTSDATAAPQQAGMVQAAHPTVSQPVQDLGLFLIDISKGLSSGERLAVLCIKSMRKRTKACGISASSPRSLGS